MSPVYRRQDNQKRNREATHSFTMENLVALLCMVYALVLPGECLMCKSCLNRSGDTCIKEKSVKCKNASGCVTIAGFTRFDSNKIPFIYKGCPYDIKCGEWLCVTSDEFDFQSYVSCCEGENCNPDYYIPVDNEPVNNMTCPYCYEDNNTEGCKFETTVKCRGTDNLCVEYQGTFRKPDGSQPGTSFKSCANDIGFSKFSAFFGITEIKRKVFKIIPAIE